MGQDAHPGPRKPLAEAFEQLQIDGWYLSQMREAAEKRQGDLDACKTGRDVYVILEWELRRHFRKPTKRRAPPLEEPTASERPKHPTPWRWFQKAKVPKNWFTVPEREILRMVHQVHTLKMGWAPRDTNAGCLPGFELHPSKIARALGCSRDYARDACRAMVRCGFLTVIDNHPGRPRVVVSGWWHGHDAPETFAAIRECFARLRAIRPRRPIPTGRKGGKRPKRRKQKAHLRDFEYRGQPPGQYRGQYRGQYPGTGIGVTDGGNGDSPLKKDPNSDRSVECRERNPDSVRWEVIREIGRRRLGQRIAKERKRRKGGTYDAQ
jgi:hypothetical protein